ncbi:MAG: hypothetical protein HN348_03455 [Proteobacteria bacterium]|jgi:NFU1 iron-sulfur cluster scaffold homolog, mitochondrial|nr:hypothetical protein [Pseudomonadota bacterium]
MSFMDTFLNSLGMRRSLVPKEADSLLFAKGARRRINALPSGHALHITTSPSGHGHLVEVLEGSAEGPPPPGYDEPIVVGDADLHLLRGLTLDRHDDRWVVALDLAVQGRETPNPDGRLYATDRLLVDGKPLFFTRSTANPPLAERLLGVLGVKTVLFRENTVTVEREPETPWSGIDQAMDEQLRDYFLHCGHELSREDAPRRKDPLEQEVLKVLNETIIPAIHRDGGDVEFLGIEDGVVRLSLVGACRTCPSATLTLKHGIENTLVQAFPGQIRAVEPV